MLLPPSSSITHCGLNQGFHMETVSSECILVPRKEVFSRTLRFLSSTTNITHEDSTCIDSPTKIYNEECYIICANVDSGESVDTSSYNAVIPCTCHTTSGCDQCPGENFKSKLTFDKSPLIGIRDSEYFIRRGSNQDGVLETISTLYKRGKGCMAKATGPDTSDSNVNAQGTENADSTDISNNLPDSEMIATFPTDSLLDRTYPIDYFLKYIYSDLKPTVQHISPSSDSTCINICHMTLDSGEFEDKSPEKSDSTKYDTITDVYIVWYKDEAKFFTLSRDQITSCSSPFVDIIRSGGDPFEHPEYRFEVVRGVTPFDRNGQFTPMVTKWTFNNDYLQYINSHAISLVERINNNLTCVNDYLSFKFIWDEHSFSLYTFVYLKQGQDGRRSLLSCLWQPTIITPNSIDLTIKNALISASSYLLSKPQKTTNDYYIYQGLPSGNVNLTDLGMLELDSLANSGGSSPKSPNSYNTRNVRPIFPSWWSFYAQGKSDKSDNISGSNSPNSRLQRYIGSLDVAHTLPDPATFNDFNSQYKSEKVFNEALNEKTAFDGLKTWENEYSLPEKLFSEFTIKPKEESITPTSRMPCGDQDGELSLSCSRSTSYDEGLSTVYASSQSCDKSLSPVLNLSTNTIVSNDNSPSNGLDTSPMNFQTRTSKCDCSFCSQFAAYIIPILTKDSVIPFVGIASQILDDIFSSNANKVDDALFETRFDELIEVSPFRAKTKMKTRGAGPKRLVGAAGVTAKSLKDALKTCETLKQTIRRKLPFTTTHKIRGVKQARESIERAFLALNSALDGVAKMGQRLSDAVASVLEELKEEDVSTKVIPEKDQSPEAWTSYDITSTTFYGEVDYRQSRKGDKLSDIISSHIIFGGMDEAVFVSPSFNATDVTFSWEEHQPVEQRRQWMLCSVECGSPLTRSKTKKQTDKRSSPREARARALRKRPGEDEYDEYDFDTDFEEAKAKRAKKLSPRSIDYGGSQKALVPMGPLPIGVYFDASRKLWRCQWRENGKFKTKGFSLSHYKTLADARHACILYRCEVGNMTVQPEWLNPVFVQVGSLAHKKVTGKIE